MEGRGDATRVGVLVAAEGHTWEPDALVALAATRDLVTLRRCLDLHDLLAVATTGTAHVAVVDARGPGLDRDLVERLVHHQVVTVAVVPDQGTRAAGRESETDRLLGLGVGAVVADAEVAELLVTRIHEALDGRTGTAARGDAVAEVVGQTTSRGRVLAVWGATGAPGRTTVSAGLAAALAGAGRATLLVDADPYGGAVAQHLGVLDEVSGLLAVARHANAGTLTPDRVRAAARRVGEHLSVLTGLPRADRWTEVRPRNLAEVLDRAGESADHVVVDAGFGAETPRGGAVGAVPSPRSRDALVTAVLTAADDVVVVGAAEPVGLTRLARLLVDARQLRPDGPAHVVVNRMRPGLGWREHEIVDMVARVSPRAQVHFLPFDLAGADRAMQEGRSPVELDSSRLGSALVRLGAQLTGDQVADGRRPSLVRLAGRGRDRVRP